MSRAGTTRLVLLGAILGVAGYMAAFGGEYSVFDVRGTRGELRTMERELDSLRVEAARLRARVDSLEQDRFLLERLAREQYGMIRDGDLLYRFVEPEDSAADPGRRDGGS